jgi:acetylornithine deacetylase/succinyl-diaminopimelate desuccinylase-like protein
MSEALEYLEQHRARFLEELFALLCIPSISSSPEHQGEVARCAEWLADHLRTIGFEQVEVLPTAGHPVVYADWLHAPGRPTVLIYNHYDVQPVDPLDEWQTPPFEPTVREGQLYARGAADDKGQLLIHLKALEALLQTEGGLPVNVKILYEGEEEIGSEHLEPFLAAERERLAADLVLISDTAMFERGLPSICYGLRGLAYFQVDLEGPASDLHSGSYGGAVANPAEVLARLIAQLKDDQGRIVVPGFYDEVRPLSDQERAEFARLPFDEARYKRELGVEALWGEAGFSVLERLWARPTLEVCGLWGGFQGAGSKTIIPARASAKLSCRLVPDQDPERVTRLVEQHLRALCPASVRLRFTPMAGGRPSITPLDHPAVGAAQRALRAGFDAEPVFIRAGGSIPVVASFESLLGLPTVLMGFGLPDERNHAPNERFDLGNFAGGLRSSLHWWRELGRLEGLPLKSGPARS